ncbi:MAG: hypothetical protein HYV19_00265 [Gemmatimonadetes bacterium]|nr:hypothetical protein [Gemmatimonadota bacterium]
MSTSIVATPRFAPPGLGAARAGLEGKASLGDASTDATLDFLSLLNAAAAEDATGRASPTDAEATDAVRDGLGAERPDDAESDAGSIVGTWGHVSRPVPTPLATLTPATLSGAMPSVGNISSPVARVIDDHVVPTDGERDNEISAPTEPAARTLYETVVHRTPWADPDASRVLWTHAVNRSPAGELSAAPASKPADVPASSVFPRTPDDGGAGDASSALLADAASEVSAPDAASIEPRGDNWRDLLREARRQDGETADRAAARDADGSSTAAETATGIHRTTHARSVVRDLDVLAPAFRRPLSRVITRLRDEGYDVRVNETVRSQARQETLYAQGRTAPGPIVTWTRRSHHRDGTAADLVVDNTSSSGRGYERLRAIAAEEGLRTLGRRDPGHVELTRVTPEALPARESARLARRISTTLSPAPAAPTPADAREPLATATVTPAGALATNTVPSVPAAPASVAVPHAEVALRVAHVAALLSARTEASLSHMSLQVANDNGEVTRILVTLRGSAVRAAIQTDNSGRAAELSASTAQLHDALAELGLRTDAISVRHAGAATATTEPAPLPPEWRTTLVDAAGDARAASGTIFARQNGHEARADQDRRSPRQFPGEHRQGDRSRRPSHQEHA